MEIWKDINGYKGEYSASNLGKIISNKSSCLLKQSTNPKGYSMVTLYSVGLKRKTFTVHRLILSTFSENIYNKKQINHKNGIKSDNRLENLEWCNQSDNIQHALKTGLIEKTIGEKSCFSKLSKEQVLEIKRNGKNDKWRAIAKKYGVSDTTIRHIVNNKKWKSAINE